MNIKWAIDSNQSDVLIKSRHAIIAYLSGPVNIFNGYVDIQDDEIKNASVEFSLNVNTPETKLEQIDAQAKLKDFFDISAYPIISFKSTSFEKVAKNINFLKGNLTIRNITKYVELDAELIAINTYNGDKKAAFEITGQINRNDFGLAYQSFTQTNGLAMGQDIKLIANLELAV
ncbi:polyisoprenoid-binding protein [Flavobacterium sp. RSP49]|uniref:YceI family protein n=1 Tax=Flavobacterium sp. RSP49 TaxID=2497487 RepID=UPI000F82D14E|nr:YceI family protein [Flavobacterium sp. RSP49]RTY97304.1 polyisoprenoid-binding protein [Flavobacterium sp. RSP49]